MTETNNYPFFKLDSLITQEVDERVLPDFEGLEILLNDMVKGISFGEDLKQIEFRFDVYGYGGSFDAFFQELGVKKSYLPTRKKLIFNARLDYNEIKDLTKEEQLLIVKGLILDSIEGITKRKTIKDSDIDIELLQLVINETFAEYLEGYLELTE